MNDSFLDELEIAHSEGFPSIVQRQAEQYITTRRSRSTGQPSNDLEVLIECQENIDVNTNSADPKEGKISEFIKETKKHGPKQQEFKRQTEQDNKAQHGQSKVLDRKLKPLETKVKSTESARMKIDEPRAKHQELKNKAMDVKQASKEHNRRSGSIISSTRTSDPSSKENHALPDMPKEINSHSNASQSRVSAASRKIEVKDPLALLNAIKELVSTYSKQESTKILRAMQDLHINSQSNLIKHLLIQTEDLTKEIHPSRDTSRLRKLVEENERMREDIIILRLRNEELQRKVDESILIKEENVALKLKLKELLKSTI